MADDEFARLNTGARITRGNSGNGVLLTRENRAGREQNSRNGKGVRLGGRTPFQFALVFNTPRTLAGLRLVCDHLRRRFIHFELGAHFLDLRGLLFELSRESCVYCFLFSSGSL